MPHKKSKKLPTGVRLIIGCLVLIAGLYFLFSLLDLSLGLNLISLIIIASIGLAYGLNEKLNIARIGTIIYSCFFIGLALFNIGFELSKLNISVIFRILIFGIIIAYLNLPEIKEFFR